jgi:hypothetical protein
MHVEQHLAKGESKPAVDGADWELVGNGLKSSDILACVPCLAVDPLSIRGTSILTQDEVYRPREINNRRLAARKRRQRIERDKAGLFAGEVAADQLDPAEELKQADARMKQRIEGNDSHARWQWTENFIRLAKLPPDHQARIVAAWNVSVTPSNHAYFSGFLTKALASGLAEVVTDRSAIADPELRAVIERMDKCWRTLKDIERAAKPDSPMNITGQRLAEELAKYQQLGVEPPNYVSTKPSWEEIQARKQIEREIAEAKAQVEKERAKKELLFDPDELKSCLPVISNPVT